MTRKHVRARTAKAARNKAGGKQTVVTKVNYIPGTKKSGMRTYDVTTRKRRKK